MSRPPEPSTALGGPGAHQEPALQQRRVPRSPQEEAKAKEEEGVPDEEGWVKVTRRGRRPVLPRTEAASLRVLEREKRKRARKELLNFYAWQHRETKMERKGAAEPVLGPGEPGARAAERGGGPWPQDPLSASQPHPAAPPGFLCSPEAAVGPGLLAPAEHLGCSSHLRAPGPGPVRLQPVRISIAWV